LILVAKIWYNFPWGERKIQFFKITDAVYMKRKFDKRFVEIARLYAQKVKSRMPVSMVVLYGSHVKGTARKTSDIDIAVAITSKPALICLILCVL